MYLKILIFNGRDVASVAKMLVNLLRFGESGISSDQQFSKNAIPRIYYAISPAGDVAENKILQIMSASLFWQNTLKWAVAKSCQQECQRTKM